MGTPKAPRTIGDFGEKRLIAEFLTPFYNPTRQFGGVGDDCAFVPYRGQGLFLASTDRVPADLTAFRLGLIGFRELGRYLAVLNISDVAACGGTPSGLLLNFGLPSSVLWDDFVALCSGVKEISEEFSCPVLGGDLSDSREISLSATSLGFVDEHSVLSRDGALPGDVIFASRPIGITSAALAYFTRRHNLARLSSDEEGVLLRQFTELTPMVQLGRELALSRACTSCMDNTDGIGQSLSELAAASGVGMRVARSMITIPPVVRNVADLLGGDSFDLSLGPGADFSLVGTLRRDARLLPDVAKFGVFLIGEVEEKAGVRIQDGDECKDLEVRGWNYFVGTSQ